MHMKKERTIMTNQSTSSKINNGLPMGGTELQSKLIYSRLNPKLLKNKNIILSTCDPKRLKKDEINIIWQQLSYDQQNVQRMKDRKFVDDVDWFVFNSHWSFNEFRRRFNCPEYKSRVIQNCVAPFPFKIKKPKDKLKLIYTSTPWRGLAVLVRAVERLNETRKDFEVDVYSSTEIYGEGFAETMGTKFEAVFAKCREIPNINFKGYAPNDQIRGALMNAHIFAYPSVFEETSCIAAIEALAAGCRVVTTNYGALPETCGSFARYVEFETDAGRLIENYAAALDDEMNKIYSTETKHDLDLQINHYNTRWSVIQRIKQWEAFLGQADANSG